MAKRDYPTIRVDKTQLVWPSKFDQAGNVRPVEKTILPFQTVETVNESKADREAGLLFRHRGEEPEGWRNRLIWGDNKVVMSSLLPELAGKIDLIYIDPPFATGQDFSFRTQVGDQEVTKQPSIIEEKAYRDTWGRGLDSYLSTMYDRFLLMRELLSNNGSILIHCDDHVNYLLRAQAQEIFGPDCFLNEIVWQRVSSHNDGKRFGRVHDTVFWYAKSTGASHTYNRQTRRVEEPEIAKKFPKIDKETGQRYFLGNLSAAGPGPARRFGNKMITPPAGAHWRYAQDRINELVEKGIIEFSSTGRPCLRLYYDPHKSLQAQDIWGDLLMGQGVKVTHYDTEKPEKFLGRIVKAASEEGGLVADFFCGSGTTGVVAEKLGRRWIMCDLSKWAIQVTRKRLLGIDECRPFQILNLGNYQRHKLAANGRAGPVRYVRFILDLYRGEFQTGFRMLHGKKGRAMVHVGSVDSPITLREIREALAEAKDLGVREVHFLGWDFEMGLHDLVDQVGEEFAVKVRLVSIPRESLEVTDPAREHLRFFDLNYLDVAPAVKGRKATVTIKDFVIANPEYLPDEVREGLKKFSDTIDYWAVDWDYKGDTFHNGWQDFRTRKKRTLKTEANHEYEKKGAYRILVKVVDVFGNDTTKVLEVKVK